MDPKENNQQKFYYLLLSLSTPEGIVLLACSFAVYVVVLTEGQDIEDCLQASYVRHLQLLGSYYTVFTLSMRHGETSLDAVMRA